LRDGEHEYVAEVLDVRSGDDLTLMVDLKTSGLFKRVRARLSGVDAPDAFKKSADTEAGRVREIVKNLIYRKAIRIIVHNEGSEKSGWIVTAYPDTGYNKQTVNSVLIDMGYTYNSENRGGRHA
jgi:hypothetical protein